MPQGKIYDLKNEENFTCKAIFLPRIERQKNCLAAIFDSRLQDVSLGSLKEPKQPPKQNMGTAQPRPRPFLSSSRGALSFSFLRVPPDDAPHAPSTQWNTEKPQRFFI